MSLVKWPISPPSAQITTSRFTAQSKADNHDSVDALKNPLECINIRIREASEKSIPERGVSCIFTDPEVKERYL
jgi:translation initiation factor IF-2